MEKRRQETMKAAFLEEFGEPLVIREIDKPPVSEDEVFVKIEACDLSRSTFDLIMGRRDVHPPKLPFIPGTGASGIVESVGSRVKKVRPGDPVVIHGILHCGHCAFCLQKRDNLCLHAQYLGKTVNGVLAEYIKMPETNVIPIPSSLDFPEASILSAAMATSYHTVQESKIEPGHSIAIYGSGSIGLDAMVLILKKTSRVIAIDIDEKKLQLAKELGAWETINAKEGKPSSAVRKLTAGGVDRALVMVGEPRSVQEALLSVKPGGKVILAGSTPKSFTVKTDQFIIPEISLIGTRYAPNHLMPELIMTVIQQQINLAKLISHVFHPLSEVNRGLELFRDQNPLKVIIRPW